MKLSIITINWNNREGLRMTINSVLSQTARNSFEYIVVDGGAPDGSREMIEQEFANRLDRWVSVPVKPIYQKMNMGVRMANGDYCLFLNSGDNLYGNDAIEKAIDQLYEVDLVLGKMIFLATGLLMETHTPVSLLSLYDSSIPHNAAFIKRGLLLKYPYDESLKIVSDWKFFVETLILDNASYRTIDNIIAEFDCNGISSKNRDLSERERQDVLHQLFPPRVLLDLYHYKNGSEYQDTTYDRFFTKLKKYRASRVIYSLDVFLLKLLSCFKKSARWARDYQAYLER